MAIRKQTLYCDKPAEHLDSPKVFCSNSDSIYCGACLDNEANRLMAMSGVGHLRVGETSW